MSLRVLAISGSPQPGGRTTAVLRSVLAGAESQGASVDLVELVAGGGADPVVLFEPADAVIFGSPVYRATYGAVLKDLLERTGRGRWGETSAPLQGKVAAITLTGASAHHYLALDDLRSVLAGFFAVQVLSPGLYFEHSDFTDRTELGPAAAEVAFAHGVALVDLADAVRRSDALRGVTPQI